MPASSGIGCILRIHNVIFVNQCKSIKTQQRLNFTDCIPQFLLRINLFIFNESNGFFHFFKVVADQILDGLRATVRHCLKIKGTDC